MGVVYFLAGVLITTAIAFLISKRSTREIQRALTNESSVTKSNTRDSFVQLFEILDFLETGVVVADNNSNQKFRNKAAIAMTGIRYVDILIDQAVDEMIRQVEHEGTGSRILEAVAGTTRFLQIRGHNLNNECTLVTVEDITAKSRIETVQTDFVANLSHELKTPIGAVAALADSLTGETETEVVWRLAERIVSESHRMARIVDALLDLSRIEFSGTEDWTKVDLAPVLVEVVSTNQHAAKRQGIGLSLTGASLLNVLGDRSQLVSGFSNLVDNAIKYSEPGGIVSVSSSIVGEEVVVAITDHGIGISKQQQDRIFERFYRVDKARSRATGGTGLGLSIVRHIVLEHGGTIEVVSEEGVGSTFTVRLPQVLAELTNVLPSKTGALI
ncbi:MAG: two-component histidine kinase PhoR [Actinomycetota bacterium]